MAITFQKRQKEMKRLEKQREKAERREQRKLAKRMEKETGGEQDTSIENIEQPEIPVESEPQG
jgi:hypothetical protein